MEFKAQLKKLGDRINEHKAETQTEEATKTAFVMPFINILGYDVFNPREVVPEHNCDIGTKKGEKIDYAIHKDGQPIILIECKHWEEDLNVHSNQLLRYFGVSKAKFGLLTNGIKYRFYTDLEKSNIMDDAPFLEVDITKLKDSQVEELRRFHKSNFNERDIIDTASELKHLNEMRAVIEQELNSPSDDLVRILAKRIFGGQMNARNLEYFGGVIKRSFAGYVNDLINERLKSALQSQEEKQQAEADEHKPQVDDDKIVTTEEEMEAFHIIKAILRSTIPSDRIFYRDAQNYFTVIIDDNNRKLVCRLYLNSPTNKMIGYVGGDKKEIRQKISSIDEIYNYADQLIEIAKNFM